MNSTASGPHRGGSGRRARHPAGRARTSANWDDRIDGGFDPELTEVSGREDVTPPHGKFFLMTDLVTEPPSRAELVRRIDDERAELRRILPPQYAAHGPRPHARPALDKKARSFGATTAVVSLNPEMTEGIAMFRNRGDDRGSPSTRTPTASAFLAGAQGLSPGRPVSSRRSPSPWPPPARLGHVLSAPSRPAPGSSRRDAPWRRSTLSPGGVLSAVEPALLRAGVRLAVLLLGFPVVPPLLGVRFTAATRCGLARTRRGTRPPQSRTPARKRVLCLRPERRSVDGISS
ncbi:hypothetical protein QJS66_13155 [Kocuria rhizophila]|nr:hypothetical protein QJS66_13155 [Kocuria rhizophila]